MCSTDESVCRVEKRRDEGEARCGEGGISRGGICVFRPRRGATDDAVLQLRRRRKQKNKGRDGRGRTRIRDRRECRFEVDERGKRLEMRCKGGTHAADKRFRWTSRDPEGQRCWRLRKRQLGSDGRDRGRALVWRPVRSRLPRRRGCGVAEEDAEISRCEDGRVREGSFGVFGWLGARQRAGHGGWPVVGLGASAGSSEERALASLLQAASRPAYRGPAGSPSNC